MYFYKLKQDGKTVFATKSDDPIRNPDYEEMTKEEYEAFTGETAPEPAPPQPTADELLDVLLGGGAQDE